MHEYGLKLWSINDNYVDSAMDLYDKGLCDYIELYAVPNSFNNTSSLWKNLNIPYIMHGPHFAHGVNFSLKEYEQNNIEIVKETIKYADFINAEKIIFHPGIKGDYKETARQLKKMIDMKIIDSRVIIENKPLNVIPSKTLKSTDTCVGYNPEQIKYIKDETGLDIVLDIGHATCAANALNLEYKEFLKSFLSIQPYMFHLSDGDIDGVMDKHLHIGSGTYDFEFIFSILPKNSKISVETEKNYINNLDDYIQDIYKLRNFEYESNLINNK